MPKSQRYWEIKAKVKAEKEMVAREKATMNRFWEWAEQDLRENPITKEEIDAAVKTVAEVIDNSTAETVVWLYDHGSGKFGFNEGEGPVKGDVSWRDAVNHILNTTEGVLSGCEIRVVDNEGNLRSYTLEEAWDGLKKEAKEAVEWNWDKIGPVALKTLQQLNERRKMYVRGDDPQAERYTLMRRYGVSWAEAIERWPLERYADWKGTR